MAAHEAHGFYQAFIAGLQGPGVDEKARELWSADDRWTRTDWTLIATEALVAASHTVLASFGAKDARVAAKGHPDEEWGRSEYLTLDVVGYDKGSYQSPLVAVEHENGQSRPHLEYCAWKLAAVRAWLRVLVLYVDPGRHYAKACPASEEELGLHRVVAANPDIGPMIVIAGDWAKSCQEQKGWRAVFRPFLVHKSGTVGMTAARG